MQLGRAWGQVLCGGTNQRPIILRARRDRGLDQGRGSGRRQCEDLGFVGDRGEGEDHCQHVIILYLKKFIYNKKMRNEGKGLICSQRWEHVAPWQVRGNLEAGGQARTTKASGRCLGAMARAMWA